MAKKNPDQPDHLAPARRVNPKDYDAIFGPGCYIDYDTNTIYGANGVIYYDVRLRQKTKKQQRLIAKTPIKKDSR